MVVTLQGPENWHNWISFLALSNYSIWDLVNPSKEQKSTPLPPPAIPTQVNHGAVDIKGLTVTEISRLNALYDEYLVKLERYKD
ncbi:hypothetical protein ACQKWADRAFT_295703 [Trichoderma austrokoningii]